MNSLTLDPVPYSRSALATVVVAHVAAALLIVQAFEARRHVEPLPLLVSLVPALQEPEQIPERRSPVPKAEAVRQAEPEPQLQPVFRPEPPPPVVSAPAPVERAIVPDPVPEPLPTIERVTEPVRVAPEPPPPAIVESPVALVIPPAPAVVATPAPKVNELPAPPDQHVIATPVPATPAPDRQETAEIVMNAQTLTAIYLRNPKPLYPTVSRRLGEQGTVMLRVFVTIAGEPAQIELKSSSGFPRLDRSALSAVRSWKFSPATRGDHAVDAWVLVPIRFTLKG